MNKTTDSICTTIAPWLSVQEGVRALEFYKAAFGAIEVYHLDGPDGAIISRLSVDGAEFWVSGASTTERQEARKNDAGLVRMILTVADPDAVFAQAVAAGARAVFPVGEEYGWRLGRVEDPFGLHWEIGHPLAV